jgi:hypothetical protein
MSTAIASRRSPSRMTSARYRFVLDDQHAHKLSMLGAGAYRWHIKNRIYGREYEVGMHLQKMIVAGYQYIIFVTAGVFAGSRMMTESERAAR